MTPLIWWSLPSTSTDDEGNNKNPLIFGATAAVVFLIASACGYRNYKKKQNNGQTTETPDPNTSSAEKCSQDSDSESSLGDSAVEHDKLETALDVYEFEADV